MNIVRQVFSAVIIVLVLTGCYEVGNKFTAGSAVTKTAVVDLNAVSKATGHDEVISKEMEVVNANLTSQIQTITDNLNKVLAEQKEKFGKKITVEQQQQLQELLIKANQQLELKRNEANQKSAQHKQSLILTWRDQLQPIVQAIAEDNGASVVLVQNPLVMWFDTSLDITADVIAKLRANPLETIADADMSSDDATDEETNDDDKPEIVLDSSGNVI